MSQNQINLYDDSVLKLSIKQGTESDRFPATFDNTSSLDYEITKNLPGSFTMGEPVFTRDTGRVFIGNFTDKQEFLSDDEGNQQIQQTLGGTLVGNKYLGFIDSKPPYNSTANSHPRSLSESETFTLDNGTVTLSGCLTDDSDFRTYNYVANDGVSIATEDKKWSRQSFYNEKYDAYDGDYMYDIYRNALIIFDHNIKPGDGDLTNKTRIRSKISAIEGEPTDAPQLVKKHTEDMYGDGYVCLYNIIPDGDTITFDERAFNSKTGVATTTSKNYTQNIVKVQKVYADAIENALDSRQFTQTTSNGGTTVMTLKPAQKFTDLYLDSDDERLTLPARLGIANNFNTDIVKFIPKDEYDGAYAFSYRLEKVENNINYFTAELLPTSGVESLKFKIKLGAGLSSGTGAKEIELSANKPNATLQFETSISQSSGSLVTDPYSIGTDDVYSYGANIAFDYDGTPAGINIYSAEYIDKAKPLVDLYDNTNTAINYLNYSTPLLSTSASITDKVFEFAVEPVVYCANITKQDSSFKTIGINLDKNNSVTITNEKGYTTTFDESEIFDNWKYFYNNASSIPSNAIKESKPIYITHEFQQPTTEYSAVKGSTPATVTIANAENGITIKKQSGSNVYTIVYGSNTISNVSKIFFRTGEITNLNDAFNDMFYVGATYSKDNTEEVLTVPKFYTTDASDRDAASFEITAGDTFHLITIPTQKYIVQLEYDKARDVYDGAYIENVTKITYYYTYTTASTSTSPTPKYSTEYKSATVDKAKFNDDGIITGSDYLSGGKQLYGIELENDKGEKYPISLSRFISADTTHYGKYSAPNYVTSTSSSSQTITFTPMDEQISPFELNERTTTVETKEAYYYRLNKTNINKIIDAPAFYYYKKNEDDDELICLGDTGKDGFDEEEWKQTRKAEILSSFGTAVPKHASSIILECETQSNSTLKLNYVGNAKTTKSLGSPANITLSGIVTPNSITAPNSWNNDKQLISIGSSTKQIVEVPIAIDDNGNRHMSISLTATGTTNINLAGYKA